MTQIIPQYQLSVQTYKDLRSENEHRQLRILNESDFNSQGKEFVKRISSLYGFRADEVSIAALRPQLTTSKLFSIYSFKELEYMFQAANEDGYLERSTDWGKDVVNASLVARVVNHYKKSDEYNNAKEQIVKEKKRVKLEQQRQKTIAANLQAKLNMIDIILKNRDIENEEPPYFKPHLYEFMVQHFYEHEPQEKVLHMWLNVNEAIETTNREISLLAPNRRKYLSEKNILDKVKSETTRLAKRALFFEFCLNNDLTRDQMIKKLNNE